MTDIKLPGSNELIVNQATMINALQEYLSAHGGDLLKGARVSQVSEDRGNNTFTIKLSETAP